MSWIDTAILSTLVLGVVNVLDSHILSRRMPGWQVYLLLASLFHLTWGTVFLVLFPLPQGTSFWVILLAIASGIIRATGLTLVLYIMVREEVSQVIPVVFTYPVFVAIIAIPVLGESLHYLEWIAIIIVVSGAVMVSLKKSSSGSTTWPGRMFLLLLGSSLLVALADITSKYALSYISSWNMFSFTALCLAGVFIAVSMRPHALRDLSVVRRQPVTIALIVLNETLAPAGMVLLFWAMERGPVSLVSTIMGSRPIFVAAYTLVVSRFSPRFLTMTAHKGMLAVRLVATAMIVGGIAIIYLK